MSGSAIDPETYGRLLDITGGDLAFIDELVDTYLDDGAAQVAALREAARGGDVAAIVRPAHTLKSSSASVGALTVAELCRVLEADARAGVVADAAARADAVVEAFGVARDELLASRGARGS